LYIKRSIRFQKEITLASDY